MKTTLRLLGAARGVTGSACEIAFGAETVLVDCGAFQGMEDADDRNAVCPVEHADRVRAVVLTHAHLDHVGRLPVFVRAGYARHVLGHPATLALAEIVLRDAAKVAARERGSASAAAFSDDDVDETLRRFTPLGYGARREIADGVHATLFDAGHILGSASVLVEGGGTSVVCSGDLGRTGAPILRDPNTTYPDGLRVDHVVIESTYGASDHPPRGAIEARLRGILRRALEDGGKVLIPAFSIGRTQELLYHLRAAATAGELAGIPVVVDGPMGLDATSVYGRFADVYDAEARALLRSSRAPIDFEGLYAARTHAASERARCIDGPAVVVAGSGMCSGGRILGWLEELLPDPRTDVLLVGYQARGTLGRRLADGAPCVTIDGREVLVRARVTVVTGLSAHAGRIELLHWLSNVPGPVRSVFVGHGEPKTSASLAAAISSRGTSAVVPAQGERFALAAPAHAGREATRGDAP